MEIVRSGKNKKSAYTLIELIAVIAIFSILATISLRIIIGSVFDYLIFIEKSIEFDNLENCMINIDNLLRSNFIDSIEIDGDKIIVATKSNHYNGYSIKKIIYLKENDLMIKTLESDFYKANNVLLRNVEEFKVVEKNNLIYFSINTKMGERRIRCI